MPHAPDGRRFWRQGATRLRGGRAGRAARADAPKPLSRSAAQPLSRPVAPFRAQETRSVPFSCAVAVAAHLLRVPVRLSLGAHRTHCAPHAAHRTHCAREARTRGATWPARARPSPRSRHPLRVRPRTPHLYPPLQSLYPPYPYIIPIPIPILPPPPPSISISPNAAQSATWTCRSAGSGTPSSQSTARPCCPPAARQPTARRRRPSCSRSTCSSSPTAAARSICPVR